MNKIPILCAALVILTAGSALAEMSSGSYKVSISVLDTTGTKKNSASFNMLDAVGQPSTIGESTGNSLRLESGFLYRTIFSRKLDKVLSDVLVAVTGIKSLPGLDNQQKNDLRQTERFLNSAITAWDNYQGGDLAQLTTALNDTKQVVKNLADLQPGIDTAAYQEMLGLASQLAVENAIKDIELTAGGTNQFVIDAWLEFETGTTELYTPDYWKAVQSFSQAFNTALGALA